MKVSKSAMLNSPNLLSKSLFHEPQTCCYFQTIQDRTGYQRDPELLITYIFWDMETNTSYQAIGSEKQIFRVSENQKYNQNRLR